MGAYRYLTKGGRALACDYINMDAPAIAGPGELPEYGEYDWGRQMDVTRAAFGNDDAWRGMRARTYKHYILSPDPKDGVSLDDLRRLATGWAEEHFGRFEVAIVYHDDNAGRIPHAHIVVNNTDLETGRRLQVPDGKALNRSLQEMAKSAGLSPMRDEPAENRFSGRAAPRAMRQVHVRRAEAELAERGEYSWVADIRARVRIARSVALSEGEFKSVLALMGVSVSDNSPKAARRDWVYSLDGHETWRVSGERLGLSFGREAIEAGFGRGRAGHLSDMSEQRLVQVARSAAEIGSIGELRDVAFMVEVNEHYAIRSLEDYRLVIGRMEGQGAKGPEGDGKRIEEVRRALRTAESTGIMPERAPRARSRQGAANGRVERDAGGRVSRDSRQASRERRQEAARSQQRRGEVRRRGQER